MMFEACYVYGPNERYNNGRGLAAFVDKARAEILVSVFAQRAEHGEVYAIEVQDEGRVVMAAGPSMATANASMRRAWRNRYSGSPDHIRSVSRQQKLERQTDQLSIEQTPDNQ